MSIQNVVNPQTYTQSRRSSATRASRASASFQDRLTKTAAEAGTSGAQPIQLYMGESFVFSGGKGGRNGNTQEVHAAYTADSTPEDPIVRVFGTSDSGPYEFTRHIKDIDPSNASYAELAALYGYLQKTGTYQSALPSAYQGVVLPSGMEPRDVTVKKDYISEIQRFQNDPHVFGPYKEAQAAELIALYRNYASGRTESSGEASRTSLSRESFVKTDLLAALSEAKTTILTRMKESKEKKEEKEAWENLMEYVDAWIETLREGTADTEKVRKAIQAYAAANSDPDRPDAESKIFDELLARLAG